MNGKGKSDQAIEEKQTSEKIPWPVPRRCLEAALYLSALVPFGVCIPLFGYLPAPNNIFWGTLFSTIISSTNTNIGVQSIKPSLEFQLSTVSPIHQILISIQDFGEWLG